MRLHAISDLHLAHRENRDALAEFVATRDYRDDWLIVAGDVGERPEHLTLALEQLTRIFAHVLWSPGNHDLWCPRDAHDRTRGQARYEELVAICRAFGVSTPEDEYRTWPDDARTHLVPMFLLYDYTFRPPDVPADAALAWARESGVVCSDERLLDPVPWPSRQAWCHARIGDAAQAAAADRHAFGRSGHQHGKRDPVLAQRLLERRNGSALRVDQAFLLGSVERGRCARLQPLLNQVEHARRAGKVFARNAQTILRGQYLEIGVGGGDHGGEGDDLAIKPAGDRRLLSSTQSRTVLAPEIDLVTCAEHG